MLSIPNLFSIDLRSPPQLILLFAQSHDLQLCRLGTAQFWRQEGDITHIDLELCNVHCAHPQAMAFRLFPWTELLPRA